MANSSASSSRKVSRENASNGRALSENADLIAERYDVCVSVPESSARATLLSAYKTDRS